MSRFVPIALCKFAGHEWEPYGDKNGWQFHHNGGPGSYKRYCVRCKCMQERSIEEHRELRLAN